MTTVLNEGFLESAVERWRQHFLQKIEELGTNNKSAIKLLTTKNLAMYWALGCVTVAELSR